MVKLKEKLIQKIQSSDNEDLLNDIYKILSPEENKSKIILDPEDIQLIKQAQSEASSGQLTKHDDFEKELDKWEEK